MMKWYCEVTTGCYFIEEYLVLLKVWYVPSIKGLAL